MKARSFVVLVLGQLFVQATLADAKNEFYERYYANNFRGWSGIIFLCTYDPADSVLAQICSRASTDIELLAASHRMELQVARPNDHEAAAYEGALQNFVSLEYALTATTPDSMYDVKAVNARLSYIVFYSSAIEADAKPGAPGRLPRSGDLEIWSTSTIGAGSAAELAQPFSDGAESNLKQALGLFLRHRK